MENALINFEDKKVIETLQKTVARGTTQEEFWVFANYCKSTGLNPLKNEVWCVKTQGYENKKTGQYVEGRLQIMTGINGYRAIANSQKEFDGMETTTEFREDRKPISSTCIVYRKDRTRPHKCTVYFSEYYKPGYNGKESNWDKMPITMLEKVAQAHALREAFPQQLNGLYIEEEMSREYSAPVEIKKVEPTPLPEPVKYSIETLSREQELYFAKRGVVKDPDTGYWVSPIDLGPKLEAYKVKATDWIEEAEKAQKSIAKEMEAA